MIAFLEIGAGLAATAALLVLSWRALKRPSTGRRDGYGVVSREWLLQHQGKEPR